MFGVSRSLSVTTGGSSTNASFGGESGVVVVVTQNGAVPVAFDATHPAGSAGAVTPSKFSFNAVPAHGGVPVGVADGADVGVAVAVDVAVGVGAGVPPQLLLTLNTMCMFGKPSAAVVSGEVTPHAGALR
jgi:hypothetical protein